MRPLVEIECVGMVTQMLTQSLAVTPMAMLARPVAGVRKTTLIITLPGSHAVLCNSSTMPHSYYIAR